MAKVGLKDTLVLIAKGYSNEERGPFPMGRLSLFLPMWLV